MKTLIKSHLMEGYCSGLVPAWFVRVVFSVLRLRGY